MDIHRCRFVPYPPSTINVLAFSYDHAKERNADVRLAIGRANGDIEIWNPLNGAWLQELVIPGGKDRSIDGLAWVQDPDEEIGGHLVPGKLRLFSIGYTTTVTEWNLSAGEPLRHTSGNHGEIWCMAAQPALSRNQAKVEKGWKGQNLATGCTDGGIVLYSTEDDELKLQRILSKPSSKKAKIISITFQNRQVVVAGCSDSTIRLFDVQRGTNIRNMSLGSGPSGGPKEIIVWAVKCLPNGNIVSGDSSGELRIWDGKTHTQTQRLRSHTTDVLSLATSSDGTTIFSGGMDRRTVRYRLNTGKSRWAKTSHQRLHDHDVKAMATFENKSMSVVVSGGVDTAPLIIPLREFDLEHHRKLQFLPQTPPMSSVPSQRFLMSFWDHEVRIWRITKRSKAEPETDESENESEVRNPKLVARILTKGDASITSAAISTDGTLLAISNASEIKLFSLEPRQSIDRDALKISKIATPSNFTSSGARRVEFSPDGKWLCIIRNDSRVLLARIQYPQPKTPQILNTVTKLERLDRKKCIKHSRLADYNRTITRVAFSSDSRILAVSDLAGFIDTWVLQGIEDLTQEFVDAVDGDDSDSSSDDEQGISSDDEEDEKEKGTILFGQRWILNPSADLITRLPSAPVVLSFRPTKLTTIKSGTLLSNGPSIPHPTRHAPHPVSHTLDGPPGDVVLMAVTSTNQVFGFEVLKGVLSSWSRRNPTECFPQAFRNVRDVAMGAFWDVTGGKERMWLYGVSWLWMFDLSKDLKDALIVNGKKDKKRKRGIDDDDQYSLRAKTPKKGTSGAGSRIPDEELGAGIGRKVLHMQYEEDAVGKGKTQVLSHHLKRPRSEANTEDEESDGEEEDEHGDVEMGGIREHTSGRAKRFPDADPKSDIDGHDNALVQQEESGLESEQEKKNDWSTFKYRPIMGIVPISGRDGLEVVLVERPIWEVDLPPRFYGDQEWEKPGVRM